MEENITIIIADDKEKFRNSIKEKLLPYQVTVLGEAAHGKEVLTLLNRVRPDVILLDLEMPIMNGNQAFKLIKQNWPGTKVIIISYYFDSILTENYRLRGAEGFIPKDEIDSDLLYNALKHVKAGGRYFYENANKENQQFTISQTEIMPHIFEGKTNREIASELRIGERRVEKFRARIYKRCGVEKAIDFYKFAFTKGLQFLGRTGRKE